MNARPLYITHRCVKAILTASNITTLSAFVNNQYINPHDTTLLDEAVSPLVYTPALAHTLFYQCYGTDAQRMHFKRRLLGVFMPIILGLIIGDLLDANPTTSLLLSFAIINLLFKGIVRAVSYYDDQEFNQQVRPQIPSLALETQNLPAP